MYHSGWQELTHCLVLMANLAITLAMLVFFCRHHLVDRWPNGKSALVVVELL
jgi:hypothetical protein